MDAYRPNRYQTLQVYSEARRGYTAQCCRWAIIAIRRVLSPSFIYAAAVAQCEILHLLLIRNTAQYTHGALPCCLLAFGSGLVCTGPGFYGHKSAEK